MLKIKKIEFIKVVYDESLSHNIFSIANIIFSNYESIHGALLYWRKNNDKKEFTAEGDYKFFYDMDNITYFASVKFPKHVRLTKDQKQELAYILLEERGSVGSYSFPTHPAKKKSYPYKKQFQALAFPDNFDVKSIPSYIKSIVTKVDTDMILHKHPQYDPSFITEYAKWRYKTAQIHPNDLKPYLPYIDFDVICYLNPYLSESYLIEHLDNVNFEMLAGNYSVLNRLSESFRSFIYSQLEPSLANELRVLLENDVVDEEIDEFIIPFEETETADLQFFQYDLGTNKWIGGEHLVKGIPSLACQQYDSLGYKKESNKEMDAKFESFNAIQRELICTTLAPHWIHRYRDKVNWTMICETNPHLTEDFLSSHIKYVDFYALGNNTLCYLSEEFVNKYMNRFNHQQPVPLVIRHLTQALYLTHKDTIMVDSHLLHMYNDLIDDEEFLSLQNLIEP
ncbi:nucleoside-diphosphate sugar epimerase [Lysinibacillus sp. 54212]|uniref:nucleoside-diphosphate sugar epimerase n=1 Tax=Lysinibacillus sp. 54212 TaxID=3119829 RepID=UPI002FCBA1A4